MQKGRARESVRERDTAGCEGNGGVHRDQRVGHLSPLALAGANSNNRARLGERHRTVVTRANPKYCYPPTSVAFTSFGITGFLAVRRGVSLFMENRRKVAHESVRNMRGIAAGFKYRIESSPRAYSALYRKRKLIVFPYFFFFLTNRHFKVLLIISKE